jgi:hypothetical protein
MMGLSVAGTAVEAPYGSGTARVSIHARISAAWVSGIRVLRIGGAIMKVSTFEHTDENIVEALESGIDSLAPIVGILVGSALGAALWAVIALVIVALP